MVGGLARYVASHPGHRATLKHREPKLAHQLPRAGSHPCFPEDRQATAQSMSASLRKRPKCCVAALTRCAKKRTSEQRGGFNGLFLCDPVDTPLSGILRTWRRLLA